MMLRYVVVAFLAIFAPELQAASSGTCPWYPYDGYHWSTCVSGADELCTEGKEQSPIDFAYCKVRTAMPEVVMDAGWGSSQAVEVVNNGHAIEVRPNSTSKLTIDSESYTLAQCHFHYGSEHTVGGVQHDLCVHCVHTRDVVPEGGRSHAVLGRFFSSAAGSASDNAFLATFVDSLPSAPGEGEAITEANFSGTVVLSDMMSGADMTHYWSYDGSLTTPGCAEIVQWRFLMDVGPVSTAQMDLIQAAIGSWRGSGNFRPPQPLHGRSVLGCEAAGCSWYPYHEEAWASCVSGSDSLCTTGIQQSPIDFPYCEVAATMSEIVLDASWMGSQTVQVVNNGHTFELQPEALSKMIVGDESYTLAQCHFHYGSEHTVGGVQHDFCVHCVHTRDNVPAGGRTHAVLGRFYSTSNGAAANNSFFANFVDHLPAAPGEGEANTESNYTGPLALGDMMEGAAMTQYWKYDGSLTTPGCAEIVQWHFLMDVGDVSVTQMDLIKASIGSWLSSGNFRPPQPLYGRPVWGCAVDSCSWYPYHSDAWANCVSGANLLCSEGKEQSPIDFPYCEALAELPEITMDAGWMSNQSVKLLNNGHAIEVRPSSTSKMTILDESYTLAQCHFHYGSEHTVGGVQHDLCVHCVHTRDVVPVGGRTHAVLGRFYSTAAGSAADNDFIANFVNELPAVPGSDGDYTESAFTGPVVLSSMMDGATMTNYWAYDGSLTTPGCAEIVQWRFLTSVGSVSSSQMDLIQTSIGSWLASGNFRPPQPLHGRLVAGCQEDCHWYPYSDLTWASCASGGDELCATGTEQSPIDFASCEVPSAMAEIMLDAGWTTDQEMSVTNNGHTFQVAPTATSRMMVGGENYTLLQCHFHYGSEHTVGGVQHDLCVHCVHARDVVPNGGRTHAVLGRFYSTNMGTALDNSFLQLFDTELPGQPGEGETDTVSTFTGPTQLSAMMDGADMTHYWAYDGSLTTPGCAEIVQWHFLMDAGVVSSRQMELIKDAVGHWLQSGNFRPPQPLHGRVVSGCEASGCAWYPYQTHAWATCVKGADSLCMEGLEQSPIDFADCQAQAMPMITLHHGWTQPIFGTIKNNGHTFEVVPDSNSQMMAAGEMYTLAQCHFHYGSEHTVGGVQHDLCVHCVHTRDVVPEGGRTHAVLGRFFSTFDGTAEENEFMASFVDKIPSAPGYGESYVQSERMSFNLGQMVADADMRYYWAYDGSLTTPGCAEIVQWHFLMDVGAVSTAQLDLVKSAIGHWLGTGNFRPPQPLHGRTVLGCQGTTCEWYPYNGLAWASCVSGADSLCTDGMEQSPIDFSYCEDPVAMQEITLDAGWTGNQTIIIANNGHTFEIRHSIESKMMIDTESYTLAQCHFHYGSEHTVGGVQHDLCVHCVHTRDVVPAGGRTHAVLGRFFSTDNGLSDDNAFLAKFTDLLPAQPGYGEAETTSILIGDVVMSDMMSDADMTHYWAYDGSLTTPGCAEVVQWHFLMDVGVVSSSQMDLIKSSIGSWEGTGNFRPPQPLYGREVRGCQAQGCSWYPYQEYAWATCVYGADTLCAEGQEQSPIDFIECQEAGSNPRIRLDSGWTDEQTIKLINNGHTFEVRPDVVAKMEILDESYTLAQCHFHYGSEHTVGGVQHDLCIHCVHTRDVVPEEGRTHAVLGRFYSTNDGAAGNNTFLANFVDDLPAAPGAGESYTESAFTGPLRLSEMMDGAVTSHYWAYDGSLTTPGCAEIVQWRFLMDVGIVSTSQMEFIRAAIGSWLSSGNFRPPQPLYGRVVVGCEEDCEWYPYNELKWTSCVSGGAHQCATGTEQSPIDFSPCEVRTTMAEVALDAGWISNQAIEVVNNGHAVEVRPSVTSKMTIESESYTLAQCHFHYGSEHFVGGLQHDLCVHCVHTRDVVPSGGRTHAVLGRFFSTTVEDNSFLAQIADQLPTAPGEGESYTTSPFTGPVVLSEMMSDATLSHYWSYDGSLTTPGCAEIVQWRFLMDVGTVSSYQMARIKSAIGSWQGSGNFRPPQPLHGRTVLGCEASGCSWYPYQTQAWATCVEGADELCASGMEQSPIDFRMCEAETMPTITLLNGWVDPTHIKMKNNGHTFEVHAESAANMLVAGESYTLAQCHFHYGSEHTVGGMQHDLCVHCVHTRDVVPAGGRTHAVLGRFFSTVNGMENAFISDVVDSLPHAPGYGESYVITDSLGPVTMSDMMSGADMTHYWAYDGSLTTPGCAEIVQWRFLMDVGQVSDAQMALVRAAIGEWHGSGNFRPPQPLHGRTVYGCKDEACDWYPYNGLAWSSCVSGADALCTEGLEQSPIDFSHCEEPATLPQIVMDAGWTGSQAIQVVNNGHTFEVRPTNESKMSIGVESYTLAQCHFHYGSEHTVGGVQHDLCVHCVHTRDAVPQDGRTHAVLGRFYTTASGTASENAFLANFIDELPGAPGYGESYTYSAHAGPAVLSEMMSGADMTHYWAYDGSLTTPGCAEIVQWHFLMDVGVVSSGQMDLIKLSIGEWMGTGNFRPPQPLHGRTVVGCQATGCAWYPYHEDAWATCVQGANELCAEGKEQSPIDFPYCEAMDMPEITLDAGWNQAQIITLVNNGHALEIRPSASAKMALLDETYTLLQCHYHYGSEHTVGGTQHDLCVHCVHSRDVVPDGGRTHAVLGRFYSTSGGGGIDDGFLAHFTEDLPPSPGEEESYVDVTPSTPVTLSSLVDGADMTHYWAYDGSLTTPGCAEIVQWRFLMDVGTVSPSQMDLIKASIGKWHESGNFRPPQPLHGRPVYGCKGEMCEWYPYDGFQWSVCVSGADHLCTEGTEQSPIDFTPCQEPTSMPEIMMDGGWTGTQQIEILNNGHTFEVRPSVESKMTIESESYTLHQCHFHYGSEHTVGGVQKDLCVHCVHTRDVVPNGGRTHAVLGRFYSTSSGSASDNAFLANFADQLPSAPGYGENATVSAYTGPTALSDMMSGASMTHYWAYDGSLTTPGCAEIVQWRFLMDVGMVSTSQMDLIKAAIGQWMDSGNFRPPQPLHGRTVLGCEATGCSWYPYHEHAWATCVDGADELCAEGREQSPIDFTSCEAMATMPEITMDAGWTSAQSIKIVNNGHTFEVQPSSVAKMMILDETYTLAQCHFHYGSEHTVGGLQHDLCVHCVHARDVVPAGERSHAVLGRFYSTASSGGSDNSFLANFVSELPVAPGDGEPYNEAIPSGTSIMSSMMEGTNMTHYWAYDGSLTTPGCAEIVQWRFLMDVGTVSVAQMDLIKEAIGSWLGTGNFRPPQPLHGRLVMGCEETKCEWYPYSELAWSSCVSGADELCAHGVEQSPIDFPACEVGPVAQAVIVLESGWTAEQTLSLENNGHTFEVQPGTDSKMKIGSESYTLAQCHFHYGSEHTVGGVQHDLCVHCVHTRDVVPVGGRSHAVLGRFFSADCGAFCDNVFGDLFADLPMAPGYGEENTVKVVSSPMTLSEIMEGANMSHYWAYDGSLTTPGCAEVVQWRFLQSVGPVQPSQMDAIKAAIGSWMGTGNFRPPQPLHGRIVLGCEDYCEWYPYQAENWERCTTGHSILCSEGVEQSPVNFAECEEDSRTTMPLITLDSAWTASAAITIVNNGHAIEVRPTGTYKMIIGSESYTLAQCHFHYGSEHTVEGLQHDLCVHCVHTRDVVPAGGRTHAVLGRFYSTNGGNSADNTFLANFVSELPQAPGAGEAYTTSAFAGQVQLQGLVAVSNMSHYWSYSGSLTTPGCAEIVLWRFLMDVGVVSTSQMDLIKASIGAWQGTGNFRPPQPLFGRIVRGCKDYCEWYPYSGSDWSTCVKGADSLCMSGMEQSPIDFPTCRVTASMPPITLSSQWSSARTIEIVNNGHAVEIRPSSSDYKMTIEGESYTLAQCHFHYGSEHTVGGAQHDLCVHCVHTRDVVPEGGRTHAVLGRFFTIGLDSENAFLQAFISELPQQPGYGYKYTSSDFNGLVKMSDMLADASMSSYWAYDGSLTTPGCAEIVQWRFLMNVGRVSNQQYNLMASAIGSWSTSGNFRPPQPLHGRTVLGCEVEEVCEWYPYDATKWATCVSGANAICQNGLEQSPIDLPECHQGKKGMPEIFLHGGWTESQQLHIVNSGHAIEVRPRTTSKMTIEGETYTLIHCDFHWGSEHTVEGIQQNLSIECVHTRDSAPPGGRTHAVLGRFYSIDPNAVVGDKLFAKLVDYLPTPPGQSGSYTEAHLAGGAILNDMMLGADMTAYWAYDGSLTTPGCSEIVQWRFLMDVGTITTSQMNSLKSSIGSWQGSGNFRPPQPLNGRYVEGCQEQDASKSWRLQAMGTPLAAVTFVVLLLRLQL